MTLALIFMRRTFWTGIRRVCQRLSHFLSSHYPSSLDCTKEHAFLAAAKVQTLLVQKRKYPSVMSSPMNGIMKGQNLDVFVIKQLITPKVGVRLLQIDVYD